MADTAPTGAAAEGLQRRRVEPAYEVLAALRAARAASGSVSSAAERSIAAHVGIPVALVHGAATYYTDLRGVEGARHVRVCGGTACFVASGGGRHITQLEALLSVPVGGCAPDGSVSLQVVHCLGYCYAGPAALDGDRPHAGSDLVDQIAGTVPPRSPQPTVGTATAPVVLRGIVSGVPSWQVWRQIVTDGQTRRTGGGQHPGERRVRAEVESAGLRGRGGAGFPAARKWRAVAEARGTGPRYVVANGDEGDPGSYADRLLMERDPARLLEGLALAALACRATQAFVYVRSEYPAAFESVARAIADAYRQGHLGRDVHGSGVDLDVDVVGGAGSYVAGEETSLLHSLAGLRATVRPRPPYPVKHGLLGRPTAVNNVETLAAVPAIVAEGGDSYAARGIAPETGTILVCLNERFRNPGAYEVELGTPLRDIVYGLGAGLAGRRPLRALQVGGPLGGFLDPTVHLDLPLLDSALTAAGATLGHGSLLAIDDQIAPEDLLAHLWHFGAMESCGTCTPCREGTRRGERQPVAAAADDRLLDTMATASLCPFGQRIPRAIRSLQQVYNAELRSNPRMGKEPT